MFLTKIMQKGYDEQMFWNGANIEKKRTSTSTISLRGDKSSDKKRTELNYFTVIQYFMTYELL